MWYHMKRYVFLDREICLDFMTCPFKVVFTECFRSMPLYSCLSDTSIFALAVSCPSGLLNLNFHKATDKSLHPKGGQFRVHLMIGV